MNPELTAALNRVTIFSVSSGTPDLTVEAGLVSAIRLRGPHGAVLFEGSKSDIITVLSAALDAIQKEPQR